MLFEGQEGSYDIRGLFKKLNKKHFKGQLPDNVTVKWAKLTRAIGRAGVSYRGNPSSRRTMNLLARYSEELPVDANVELDMNSLSIKISTMFDLTVRDIKAVMLHEMVHILLYTQKKIGTHHGTAEFDGWITKLRSESGIDNIPFKESSFKKSPKVKAKEGLVMTVKQGDGKWGIATFTLSWMKKNWLIFAKTMTRILNQAGGRLTKLELYKITHPLIELYPAKRSLRKISWTMVDEDLIREIERKGKDFGRLEIGGGSITPSVIGIRTKAPIQISKGGDVVNIQDV